MKSLLGRVLAAVTPNAPPAGQAAIAATSGMLGSGGYRGAQGDRTKRRGWFARPRSANADTLPGSARLRAEQRDAAMNQPVATAALNRLTAFVVGSGLMALPAIDAAALGLSDEEKEAWERRIAIDYDGYLSSKDPDAERRSTGYGLQSVVHRGQNTSGDILGLRVMPEGQPGRRMLTAWKLVEADRLTNPAQVADGAVDQRTGNLVAGGVEVDQYGAPVAYHILRQHPGDLVVRGAAGLIPERIDAWDTSLNLPRVVHVYRRERPEQLRGVGRLAGVLELLKMASDLTDAELFAAVMSAMIAIVYKSPGATPLPEPDFGEGDGEGGAGSSSGVNPPVPAPEYKMEAGSVLEIDSDAEVEVKTPGRPNSAFGPFFEAIVQQIGAAIDVPVGVLLLMFNSSYTASKAELETMYLHIRAERAWFADDWNMATYLCFLAEKVARGEYSMPGFFADMEVRAAWSGVNWRGDGKISLNPLQEANGYAVREAHNWQTGEEITAELTGGSFRENIKRRGREHRAIVAEGLPIPVAPGTPAKPGNDGKSDDLEDKKKKDDAE